MTATTTRKNRTESWLAQSNSRAARNARTAVLLAGTTATSTVAIWASALLSK